MSHLFHLCGDDCLLEQFAANTRAELIAQPPLSHLFLELPAALVARADGSRQPVRWRGLHVTLEIGGAAAHIRLDGTLANATPLPRGAVLLTVAVEE